MTIVIDAEQMTGVYRHWDEGFEAFLLGLDVSECPFQRGPRREQWERGWYAAMSGQRAN